VAGPPAYDRGMAKVSSSLRVDESGARSPAEAARSNGSALRPLQVTWEMTGACEWKITPTRLARMRHDRQEFSTAEAFHLIQEVAAMGVPLLALTGGDPLLRPDLFPIVEFASHHSVRASLLLTPTPMLDAGVIAELKACGLMRAAFWLHGSTASLHDGLTGIRGSHRRTLEMIGSCHEVQLPVQINTLVERRNFHDLEALIELLTRLDVMLWNVFFLVPQDRAHAEELLSAAEHEEVFARLYAASKRAQFQIKTSEGQHYQRYLLQQRVRESHGRLSDADVLRAPKGVNDSRGMIFVNRIGQVYPSRFLPISAGDATAEPLSKVFRDSELFSALRDPSLLKGKCGRCPVRTVCGGSRARAYAMTGDLFAEEPCCAYQP